MHELSHHTLRQYRTSHSNVAHRGIKDNKTQAPRKLYHGRLLFDLIAGCTWRVAPRKLHRIGDRNARAGPGSSIRYVSTGRRVARA
eukprot:2589131-Rhodomonas_salina.2